MKRVAGRPILHLPLTSCFRGYRRRVFFMLYTSISKPKKSFLKQPGLYCKDMEKLSENEIQKRMQEWRNLKVLHKKAVARNKKLERKLQNLLAENRSLRELVEQQMGMIETLKLQIEELQRIVFGRKKKKKDNNDEDDFRPGKENKEPEQRDKASYKRLVPDENDVTGHEYHAIAFCPDCGAGLEDKKTVKFYEEDIPLPNKETKLRQIILHHTEKGYCPACKKWHTACPLPSATVVLGEKVRLYIVYLSILVRLSFSQIRSILWDTYHFKISEGEIAKILHQQAVRLKPEYERIRKRLQEGRGVHLDETGWGKGLYLWVMASSDTEDVLYLAGRTRGKGNADELAGKYFKGVRVSDAYAAYKNQPGPHQQCWSHPHVKLRDLAYAKTISQETRGHCLKTYEEFSRIYTKLRGCNEEKFEPGKRADQKKELFQEIRKFRKFSKKDPQKLRNIKQQFHDYPEEWLTCMDYDGMPCDNNKAERKLRHFVIKRKISFGNKSKKGHETFETLASVLMTYWKTCKDNFLAELSALCLKEV